MKVSRALAINIRVKTNSKFQVISEREKLLSNFEVLEHLKEIQQQNNWKPNDQKKYKRSFNPDLETVTKEVVSYLEKTTTAQQSVELITSCMNKLAKFQLEKIERLQIINSAPHSLVNLYAIVEECDQRFTEEESQEILDIVEELFPQEAAVEGDDEEVVADEDVEMS